MPSYTKPERNQADHFLLDKKGQIVYKTGEKAQDRDGKWGRMIHYADPLRRKEIVFEKGNWHVGYLGQMPFTHIGPSAETDPILAIEETHV